jgi:hypothetical protein
MDASQPVTPEAAHAAFDRGDFASARRLARTLFTSGPDEATRAAAQTILKKTSVDPLIVYVTIGCVLFFTLVSIFGR